MSPEDCLKYATISEKAKAFDLLLKYHAQEGRNYVAGNSLTATPILIIA